MGAGFTHIGDVPIIKQFRRRTKDAVEREIELCKQQADHISVRYLLLQEELKQMEKGIENER